MYRRGIRTFKHNGLLLVRPYHHTLYNINTYRLYIVYTIGANRNLHFFVHSLHYSYHKSCTLKIHVHSNFKHGYIQILNMVHVKLHDIVYLICKHMEYTSKHIYIQVYTCKHIMYMYTCKHCLYIQVNTCTYM